MFSGVRCTLFTNWSRQMTFATGSASGWAFGTLVGMAEIFALTSEPMLPSTRS